MSKAGALMRTSLERSHPGEQPGHDVFGTPRNDEFYDAHVYDKLDSSKREVRLLRVLPDHGAGLVECELLCKKPLQTIRGTYSALSYCAGVPNKTQLITVNGVKFRAFANLAHALAEARHFWKKLYGSKEFLLWVDQICIDQQNIPERSQQVGLMRDIYSCAKEVLICLSTKKASGRGIQWLQSLNQCVPRRDNDLDTKYRGEESFRLPVNVPFEYFHWHRLIAYLWENTTNESFMHGWLAVYDIFESPWWIRGWVYQEFMSATHAHFLYGRNSISWNDLSPILDSYLSVSRHFATRGDLFLDKNQGFSANGPECRRLSRISEREKRAERGEGMVALMVESKLRWSGPTSLMSLLSHSRHCITSDIRDTVYAVLGLAYSGYGIVPDYSPKNSISDILIETAKKIIQFDDSLEILTHASDKGALAGLLPSWVPDWTCKEESEVRLLLKKQEFRNINHPSDWTKAHASFEYLSSGSHRINLKAWGGFVDILETKIARKLPTDDYLGAFYTAKGYTILCTSHVRALDELWVVCGSQRPLIMRRSGDGYSLISVATAFQEDSSHDIFPCRDIISKIVSGASPKKQISIH